MSVMTNSGFWPGLDRVLTVEDMEDMPDDEYRYELDDGVLIVSPAPSSLHQLAVGRLTVILSACCPAGMVVLPGVGINITRFQHRVPDLAVVIADSFGTIFQEVPPRLAVEVGSPRTRLYDRNRKKDVYQSFGIPSYWIIEPDSHRPELTAFELRNGQYTETAHVVGDQQLRAERPFPLSFAPSALVSLP
jgi:Uma2 family endonuclease